MNNIFKPAIGLAICFFFLSSSVEAEDYTVTLQGASLKNTAALVVKLEFEPADSFIIDKDFSINKNTLFKTIDEKHNLIRAFLAEPIRDQLVINGKLNRMNYKGDANVKIKRISYISELGKEVNKDNIQSALEIKQSEDVLPFIGIVKGEILGPKTRIFSKNMFIAITNVETYGCDFNRSIEKVRINGKPARFLNDNIVYADIELDDDSYNQELDIDLEFEIGDKVVNKTIGSLEIQEPLS